MRRFCLAATLVAGLCLAACASVGVPGSSLASDAKALSLAEGTVSAAADLAAIAASNGYIVKDSPKAKQFAAWLVVANVALNDAEAGYAAEEKGDPTAHATVAAAIATANAAAAKVSDGAKAPPG